MSINDPYLPYYILGGAVGIPIVANLLLGVLPEIGDFEHDRIRGRRAMTLKEIRKEYENPVDPDGAVLVPYPIVLMIYPGYRIGRWLHNRLCPENKPDR